MNWGMFSLAQLRVFVTVAQEMHFGRAAERLNMTQPPLSRQVQSLERELGMQLFDRSKRSVRLTEPGQAFLVEAQRILSLADAALDSASRAASGYTGSVRVGFTSVVGHAHLPLLLKTASENVPDIEIVLHEMVSADQVDSLASGAIDLGLGRQSFEDPEYASRELPPERLMLAMPPNSDLYDRSEIRLSDLGDRPFLMYSAGEASYFYDRVAGVLSMKGVQPRIVQRITQVHTMLGLVEAGLGVALVPDSARSWAPDVVRFAEVKDLAGLSISSRLTWRPASSNPALHRLLGAFPEFGRNGRTKSPRA